MAISDWLGEVGQGLEKGAAATGRVAGALAPAIGKAVVNEEAGYAPQIAAEGRQHTQAMEDQQINAKAGLLENQLKQLQSNAPLFNNDGSVMSPQQRTSAISDLSGQFTQLYSHPRHAGTLMEKLRQAVSPGGMTAGAGAMASQPSTPAQAMTGFTAAPPAGYQEAQDEQAQARQADASQRQFMHKLDSDTATLKANGMPDEQIRQFRNEAIERNAGATGSIVPKHANLTLSGGIPLGGTDEYGRQWSNEDIHSGKAGPELKTQLDALEAGQAKKAADAKKIRDDEAAARHKEKEAGEGTWAIDEDANGKAILFNSKTGATRPAPGGVERPGTQAKATALYEKNVAPVKSAMEYANNYAQNGVFTGPGDEALQEQFFSMAKPSSGFRMTKPQIDMLQDSRNWMNSVEAKALHAKTGQWFTPSQRTQIVRTMNDLGKGIMDSQPIGSGQGVGNLLRQPNQVNPSSIGGGGKSYKQTATGPAGQIGSNDGGNTWFSVKTGKQVQ